MKKKMKLLLSLLLITALTLPMHTYAAAVSDRNASLDYSSVFDADYYYNAYPDLQKNIGRDSAALLNHFITTGMKEGRNGNASFQVKAYMYNNLDLLPVYGCSDLSAYYIHYMTCGINEGRKAVFNKGSEYPAGTLAQYSTLYDTKEDRAVNVELAAGRINGMVLAPGDTFSFSDSVGTRTLENGYVVAPSYAGGRVVSSVGGGICQVSSTIYVVMLLAGISPTQHYFHSLPVDYVPKGLDAAIVEGYKDLRFQNNFDYEITIHATAKDGVLTVSFTRN